MNVKGQNPFCIANDSRIGEGTFTASLHTASTLPPHCLHTASILANKFLWKYILLLSLMARILVRRTMNRNRE